MTADLLAHIVAAERLSKNGVIITFEDGKCAVYSASLLHAMFSQAEEVVELETDETAG